MNSTLLKFLISRGVSPAAIATAVADYLVSHPVEYTHPPTHPATMIEQDTSNRFVTDIEKGVWDGKQDLLGYIPVADTDPRLTDLRVPTVHSHSQTDVTGLVNTLNGKEQADPAIQTHIISPHAPADATNGADWGINVTNKPVIPPVLVSGVNIKTVNGNSLLGAGDLPIAGGTDPFTARLIVSGDKPTGANTTPVTLAISFNYEVNKTYVIDIYAIVAPTAANTGCGFLLDTSSVVNYVGTFSIHQLANTGTVSGGSSIGDKGATQMGVSSGMPSTGQNFVTGSMILVGGSNAGTATIYFRSETTAVTTCKSGSVFRVMKIN